MPLLEKKLLKPDKKILFLWGPRQIGKSTILNYFYQKYGGAYFNFDDLEDQRLFIPELSKLKSVLEERSNKKNSRFIHRKASLIFIDEVQNHPEATLAIKLLADQTDYLTFATGSSELRAKTQRFDSLAGRYHEEILFPLTIDEMSVFQDGKQDLIKKPNFAQAEKLKKYLELMMTFGSYPGVVLAEDKPQELKNIAQNSIIKDIVNIYDLKSTDLVFNLLRLLSMQIGNLVNVSEIASSLGSTKITIDNYLSILVKNRVIFFLEPLRTNKRRGFLSRKKVYFYDLGIRNSLIEDFRSFEARLDKGALFENLIVLGVLRQNQYAGNFNKLYYYRDLTGSRKEIDLITENIEGERKAFEIKYSQGKINKFTGLEIEKYGIINKDNAPEFLT